MTRKTNKSNYKQTNDCSEVIDCHKILDDLDKIGIELSSFLNNQHKKCKRLIIAFDILKKIRNNVFAITFLQNNSKLNTSKNIIYRAIFSDLLTALYLLSISDKEFEYSIKILDIDHVKCMKEILPMRLRFGKLLYKIGDDQNISEQEFLDRYYDIYSKYLKNEKGEEWTINKPKPPSDQTRERFDFKGRIKDFYTYLKNCNDNENLQALANLYFYYKYLSQTEHYTYLGRRFPFIGQEKDNWLDELNISIYVAIKEIDYVINKYCL